MQYYFTSYFFIYEVRIWCFYFGIRFLSHKRSNFPFQVQQLQQEVNIHTRSYFTNFAIFVCPFTSTFKFAPFLFAFRCNGWASPVIVVTTPYLFGFMIFCVYFMLGLVTFDGEQGVLVQTVRNSPKVSKE